MLTMDDQSVVASETDGPPEGVAVVTVTNVAMVAVEMREPVIVSDTETLRDFVNRTLDVVDEIADAIAVGIGLRDQ